MTGSDVRYAVRSLVRQRLVTSLVVTMLALGIAASGAVFGLINGLFLRPFPFPDPDRLVYLNETAPRWNLDVVGINEAFAREFFPGGEDPVGRRMREARDDEARWATLVGLVGDVKHYGLERPMRPGVYFPLPEQAADSLTLALKTRGAPTALVATARALLRELDPDLAVYEVRSMEEALRRSLTARATYSFLLAVFAALALVLALGGTYGVTAYLATQRTREIGIRLAVGAQKADIRRNVLKGSLAVVVTGIGIGLLSSLGAARGLQSLLFGVRPHDGAVLGGAAAVLLFTALAASWLPAARAARIDPMTTLRGD